MSEEYSSSNGSFRAYILGFAVVLCGACGDTPLGAPGTGNNAATDSGLGDVCQDACEDLGSQEDPVDTGEDLAPDIPPDATVEVDSGAPLSIAVGIDGGVETTQGLILTGRVTLTAEITGGEALLGVEFHTDGERFDTDLIPPYSAVLDTTTYPDGIYSLAVHTADRVGNTAFDTRFYRFDNSAPVLEEKTPQEGDVVFFEDGPLAISVTVDDPETVSLVTLRANGLLVDELTIPPFETTANYTDLYVQEELLPTNVLVQHEAADLLGQVTTESANVTVMKRLSWSHTTLGEIWASPRAISDTSFVFGNKDSRMIALGETGDVVWDISVSGLVDTAVAVDSANGRFFFGTGAGSIHGARTSNGQYLWTKDISTPPGGDLAYHADTVYVPGFSGVFWALNAANGEPRWTATLPDQLLASPAVDGSGRAYIGCQDGLLYALSGANPDWSFETSNEVWGTPVLDDLGRVYFGSNDGWMYALTSDGTRIWAEEIEGQIWGQPLLTDDGGLLVGSTSRYLTRLDVATGDREWRTNLGGLTRSSPMQGTDGTIYIGTTTGNVYALDPGTGEVQWTFDVGDTVHGTPLLIGNRLFVGSTNRDFFALWHTPPEN